MKIDLNIENKTKAKIPAKKDIADAILGVLKDKKRDFDVIVTVTVVDKKAIQKLNKQYRKLDKPTDVLSFPILDVIPKTSDIPVLLGDIVICPEMINDHSFLELVSHSTLHLLGYHHK